jgi:hypothetical protein
MDQHLKVVVVLNITALKQSYPSINDHELGMKSSKDRAVVVGDLKVDVGDFT